MEKIFSLTFLIIPLFLTTINLNAQEKLEPIRTNSFGLNQHTNRDESYFSHVDSNKNLVIIGTTERDSTYTDILTTKLDSELNLIWQKRFSIETSLSYDIPVKTYLTLENQIIIIGRSAFNGSNSNGLIFLIKYGEDGNIIFNKTIGNTDGSDYKDYGHLNSCLNNDGTLDLVYSKKDPQTYASNNFNFLKIDSNGEIINSFSKEIPNSGVISLIKNNNYYFIVRNDNEGDDYYYKYDFVKINNQNISTNFELSNTVFNDAFDNIAMSSYYVNLTLNSQESLYITSQKAKDHNINGGINFTKIDTNTNELVYSVTTTETENYFFLGSFVNDSQDENIVIANNLNNDKIEFLKIDSEGDIQTEPTNSNILGTGFKKNDDGSFFVTTTNSNIRLFSDDYNELKSFNTSDTFGLVDFSRIDNETISVIGTSYDKMFSESDFDTQRDIICEKLNEAQILNKYNFSGEGTSGSFQQRIIIDNDNNYLVFVTEKLGPEYLGIGGVNPPLSQRIIKYDKNLNKIWEIDAPESISNIIVRDRRLTEYFFDSNNNLYLNFPNNGEYSYSLYKLTPDGEFEIKFKTGRYDKFYVNDSYIFLAQNYNVVNGNSKLKILDKFNGDIINEIDVAHEFFLELFTIGDDYYFYTYENISNNTPDFIYLYKNGEKIYTRELSYNYGISSAGVDDEGSIYFYISYGGNNYEIFKLYLNQGFTKYGLENKIKNLNRFKNGKLYAYLEDGNSLVLDSNLNLITNGEQFDVHNAYIIPWRDFLLLSSSTESSIRIIDQRGKVNKYFTIAGILDDRYSQIDKEGKLLIAFRFGNKIYTYNEYSWSRGFIHKYKIESSEHNDDDDDDDDGVINDDDLCPDTLMGEIVDENGCSENQRDDDLDGIPNLIDQCPNTKIGKAVNDNGCEMLEAELWGMTSFGGENDYGIIFKYNTISDSFLKERDFNSYSKTGGIPSGNLIKVSNNVFYGMTWGGGANNKGILFKYNMQSGVLSNELSFGGDEGEEFGSFPAGSFIEVNDGILYGMTSGGGAFGVGIIFEYNIYSNQFTKRHDFNKNEDGGNPQGNLILTRNGKLYGLTLTGGIYDNGTLFEYDYESNRFTKILDLDPDRHGRVFRNNLTQGVGNNLYGVSSFGGINDRGVLFNYNTSTKEFIILKEFINPDEGLLPSGTLFFGAKNKLFGVTQQGGSNNEGVFYEYDLIMNTYTKNLDFEKTSTGNNPLGGVIQASNGKIYGMTNSGGLYDFGVLYEFNLANNSYTKILDFDGANGKFPKRNILIEIEKQDDIMDSDNDGVINNIDQCPDTPLGETVNVVGCSGSQLDDDEDGVMNNLDQCQDTPIGEEVDENGCSESQKDDDGDGVMNNIDKCPETKLNSTVDANGCTLLPFDNFTIEVIGETCPDRANGQITIAASENLNYSITLNGIAKSNFTSDITFDNLLPGAYEVCIEVVGMTSPYCYKLKIVKGNTISSKSSVKGRQLHVQVSKGTSPFKIFLNGVMQFETYQNSIDVSVNHGDLVEVKTALECEGVYAKEVQLFEAITIYPNPSDGVFTIALPTALQEVDVQVFNDVSQLLLSNSYNVTNSKIELDLTDKPVGVYLVKVFLDKIYEFKVVKK